MSVPAVPLGRSLMRTRNWSIRSKIVALVAVPLAALLALWIFATTLTAGPAFNLLSARTLLDSVGNPGEVRDAIQSAQKDGKRTVLMRVKSGGEGTKFVAFRLGKA